MDLGDSRLKRLERLPSCPRVIRVSTVSVCAIPENLRVAFRLTRFFYILQTCPHTRRTNSSSRSSRSPSRKRSDSVRSSGRESKVFQPKSRLFHFSLHLADEPLNGPLCTPLPPLHLDCLSLPLVSTGLNHSLWPRDKHDAKPPSGRYTFCSIARRRLVVITHSRTDSSLPSLSSLHA